MSTEAMLLVAAYNQQTLSGSVCADWQNSSVQVGENDHKRSDSHNT